jgi:predicted outer membrane repeat protein
MTHFLSFVRRYLWSVLIAFGLPLIAVALLLAPAASARSVAELPQPAAANCYASLGLTTDYLSADATAVQQAIDAASAGDLVKIAGTCAGVQARSGTTQTAIITKVLTLQGGFTTTNWITSDLILNPTILDAQTSGRVINASTALSLSNLTIQNGHTTNDGGGLFAGGTLYVIGTQFLSNTANNGGGSSALGAANVVSSQFISNTASNYGGGADFESTASLTGTTFTQNSAKKAGGLYIFDRASVTNSLFVLNTANDRGGGAEFDGETSVAASTFTSNTAILFDGGGAYFSQASSVADSTFVSNTSNLEGGGAYFDAIANFTATIFIRNTAKRSGGGVYVFGSASVTASTFTLNTAAANGGGAKLDGVTSVVASTFSSNTAVNGGGVWFYNPANVTNTIFTRNTANKGGGIYFHGNGTSLGGFVNLLFAGNSAVQGTAIYAENLGGDDSVIIRQTTIASPTLGSGSAIYVVSGSLNLTNTLIANYSVGLARLAGTLREDYTLFSNVTKPYSGTVLSGGHSLTGTAGFVNAASNDYHLSVGSAGIDRGTSAGVFTDLDGQVRPANLGFDIGAYEYQGAIFRIFLPLALKNF